MSWKRLINNLEVRCGDKAVNTAVAVYVGSTNHALVTQSKRIGGLGTGEGDRNETRLNLHSVVGTFVPFNVFREKALSAAHRKPDYVAIAVDACTDSVARVEEVKIFVLGALKPCTVKILVKVLTGKEAVVGDAVDSPAAGAGYRVTWVHGAKHSVGPHPTVYG